MSLRRSKIPTDVKRHIVCALARRKTHGAIAEEVQQNFGLTIQPRAVGYYNPKFNARLDDELKLLYEQARVLHWIETEVKVEAIVQRHAQERAPEREARLKEQRAQLRAKTKAALLDELTRS